MMQTELFEKMSEIYKCTSKPLMEMTQLNFNTLNDLARNANFQEFSRARKPDELMALQARIVNDTIRFASDYTQRVVEIWQDAAEQTTTMINDIMHESMNHVASSVDMLKKTGSKSAESSSKYEK